MKNLLKVKSIVTILLTVAVFILALTNRINIEQIYLMIIAFYFGTQHERKVVSDDNTESL